MKVLNLTISLFLILTPIGIIVDYLERALLLPLLEGSAIWLLVGHLVSMFRVAPEVDLSRIDLPGMLERLKWTALWPFHVGAR